VELDKTVIRAGVAGRVEQFALRVGDIVNPMIRSAGVLIPEGAGQRSLQAGFAQIEAQVMKVGMVAEVTCVSKPWTVIPMVVTQVQDFIAAGQFRGGEQLIDPSNHDAIASKDVVTVRRLALHAVDAVGFVHAMILRVQALLLPIKTLVFSGH
jgi:multidrug resistance efflux pump